MQISKNNFSSPYKLIKILVSMHNKLDLINFIAT